MIGKIITLLKEQDVRAFLTYAVRHPNSLKKKTNSNNVPEYLQEVYQEHIQIADKTDLRIKKINNPYDRSESSLPKYNTENVFSEKNWTIHLAGADIKTDIFHINWFQEFKDSEDTAALHRFIWLYRSVFETVNEANREEYHKEIKRIIYAWIHEVEIKAFDSIHFEIWQTYTVVERIVNWMMLLSVTARDSFFDEVIIDSLLRQLAYINLHLEYYGEKFTGNHFGNNGRALYFGGLILGIDYYQKIGKRILKKEYERVIADNAFLREGSVHYQFLYTKWFTDIYWFAKEFEEKEHCIELESALENLLEGCRFFLIKQRKHSFVIPLIGDISPDFTPEWLLGVPWAAKLLLSGETFDNIPETLGYHTFFLKNRAGNTIKHQLDAGIKMLESKDWGKIENAYFTVYCHVNHSMYPNNLTGHFHHDSGSIVLYAEGEPLLIDCGRINYSMAPEALRGRNYTGHNILVLNGKNPEPDMRTFYTEEFMEDYTGKKPRIINRSGTMETTVFGAKRIKGLDKHCRRIILESKSIILEDIICGKGKQEMTMLFHIPEEYQLQLYGKEVLLDSRHRKYRMSFDKEVDDIRILNGKSDKIYGHYVMEYGADRICHTLRIQITEKLPNKIRSVIERVE